MENNEQLQTQDANVPEQTSDAPQAAPSESQPAPTQETKQDLPFHEHPRWKEVINERNQYATKVQELERRFEEQSRKWDQSFKQSQPQPKDALLERLKGIDPEFAARAEKWETASQRAERLEQELQSYRTQAQQEQARSQVEQLYAQNKVPTELQSAYRAQLESMARENPNLSLKDIPQMFQQVHAGWQKFQEAQKRQYLAEYSKGKAQDSVPSSPKASGVKPQAPDKAKAFTDPEEARAAAAKLMAQHLRASRNA